MKALDLLKGKAMMVLTNVGVKVELTIDRVVEERKSQDLEPATKENDYYPSSFQYADYTVHFTNGHKESYRYISEIVIID